MFGGFAAAVDLDVRKLGDKGTQELFDAVGSDLALKPGKRLLHDLRVVVFAVMRDKGVAELVDEAHGEERGGIDGGGWDRWPRLGLR